MADLLRQEGEPVATESSDVAGKTGAELRAAPRVGMLIRPAKLITPAGEFLCVIRDASETGVSARVFHDLPPISSLCLELQNGDQYPASLVWHRDGRVGLHFDERADLDRLVQSPSRFAKRPIRINLEAPARLIAAGEEVAVTLQDISGQGAKIGCQARLSIHAGIVLKAKGMRETRATVRWRRNGCYGLVFEDTMQIGELAETVQAMQAVCRINT